jgi:hypothetical protein
MAEKERLIGTDGKLMKVSLGTEVVGDGADDLDDLMTPASGAGWWQITALAAEDSVFASGLAVGDLFWNNGTLVPEIGDKAKLLTETEMSDVEGFSLSISRSEVDVTTLSDTVKRYRGGKIDMSGTVSGITEIGVTDSAGWVLNNFIRKISQAAAGTVTVSEIDDSPIYLKGVLQKDTSAGENEVFVWARVTLLGTEIKAEGEDKQSWSGNFRIYPGDPDPTLYIRAVAAS